METLLTSLGFSENYNYSTMVKNKLDQRVNYNGVECIWGLNEYGKPPTLIHPRPKIRVKAKNGYAGISYIDVLDGEETIFTEKHDFAMHLCIQKETPKDIIKAMFDKRILFEYDLT